MMGGFKDCPQDTKKDCVQDPKKDDFKERLFLHNKAQECPDLSGGCTPSGWQGPQQ